MSLADRVPGPRVPAAAGGVPHRRPQPDPGLGHRPVPHRRPDRLPVPRGRRPRPGRDVAAGALTSVVSSMNVDDVLTVQRLAIQNEVEQAAQASLDGYQAGVEVDVRLAGREWRRRRKWPTPSAT